VDLAKSAAVGMDNPDRVGHKASIRRRRRGAFRHPEYNRPIPGALKKRDRLGIPTVGENSFDHIPAAVIGASAGQIGTAWAAEPARCAQLLQPRQADDLTRGLHPVRLPPATRRGDSPDVFQDDGEVTNDSTRECLSAYTAEFRTYIGMVLTVLPRPQEPGDEASDEPAENE